MTPITELWSQAIPGTEPQWIVLVLVLPLVGRAAAATWGPSGALAAQRAVLLLLAYLVAALLFAWPVHALPFVIAALPVVGAAVAQPRPTLRGAPLAWVGAVAFSAPATSLSVLGPRYWAAVWFLTVLGLAAARGLVEPALEALPASTTRLRRTSPAPAAPPSTNATGAATGEDPSTSTGEGGFARRPRTPKGRS